MRARVHAVPANAGHHRGAPARGTGTAACASAPLPRSTNALRRAKSVAPPGRGHRPSSARHHGGRAGGLERSGTRPAE